MTQRYAHLSPQYLSAQVKVLGKRSPENGPSDASQSDTVQHPEGQSDRARKLHKDKAQRAQSGAMHTQLEHQMTLEVRVAKSLNFQRRDKLDKMFPENCPPDASQSGKWRQMAATYWRSENRAELRLASNYSQ